MNEKLGMWDVEKECGIIEKREKGVWVKCIECIERFIVWRRMEKWRKGKINESWSGGEKCGVLVRKMGECENVENR